MCKFPFPFPCGSRLHISITENDRSRHFYLEIMWSIKHKFNLATQNEHLVTKYKFINNSVNVHTARHRLLLQDCPPCYEERRTRWQDESSVSQIVNSGTGNGLEVQNNDDRSDEWFESNSHLRISRQNEIQKHTNNDLFPQFNIRITVKVKLPPRS
jgi:hypothetical protein